MVGSRVIYKTHKRSSVESYIFLKQCCFKRIFKGVVFPPSGSTVVNDRCQGHFREWVQFCLVQSLDEEIAKQLEWRVCKGCSEAGCEQYCGCTSQGQHWLPVTPTEENLGKAFAGFGMVQSFVVVFKIFEIFFFNVSEMPAVCV